jgi:hypothetical protein
MSADFFDLRLSVTTLILIMNESKNREIDYQETFVRLFLFLLIYPIGVWLLSHWTTTPFSGLLSFLITALIGFVYFPVLNRLGILRYTIIVVVVAAFLVPMYFGKFWFEESRIWSGFALALLGIMSFASNWIFLWIMSDGKRVISDDDIMTPRSYLILSTVSGAAMILMGFAVAFGFFG